MKAVSQAILSYVMMYFKIPKKLVKDIYWLIARFWWGSNGDKKKIHWGKWDKKFQNKEVRGLGFRDLNEVLTGLYLPNEAGELSGTQTL